MQHLPTVTHVLFNSHFPLFQKNYSFLQKIYPHPSVSQEALICILVNLHNLGYSVLPFDLI